MNARLAPLRSLALCLPFLLALVACGGAKDPEPTGEGHDAIITDLQCPQCGDECHYGSSTGPTFPGACFECLDACHNAPILQAPAN